MNKGGGFLDQADEIADNVSKRSSGFVNSMVETGIEMGNTMSEIAASSKTSDLIDKDILNNGYAAKILLFFSSNSGFIYTVMFIVLVILFSSIVDTILLNNTDSPKSAVFIKYSVRWWALLFCGLLIINLLLRVFVIRRPPK